MAALLMLGAATQRNSAPFASIERKLTAMMLAGDPARAQGSRWGER